jgi:predicted ATPase
MAAVADIAPQLARHFQEARITEKAIRYLHQAGERAVQLSAYQEGIAHLTRGLALLMALPDSPERAQQELALQLALGMAWLAADSAVAEAGKAYTRARELCQQTGKTSQLCRILGQLAMLHYVRAEHQRARELAEEALNLAQQTEDPLLVAPGHWRLGFVLFGLGEYTAARAHLEGMISFYEPQHHHRLVSLCGSDAGVSALAYDACCLWCLGYPDQALMRSQEALALARELGHPFSLADVLCYAGCLFNEMRRDAQALKDNAEELMRLSSEKVPGWLGEGTWHRGKALAMLGQVQEGMAQMREGMAAHQSRGVQCYLSGTLRSLAEAQAKAGQPEEALTTLAEAFAFVEQTDERHWEAELYRLRAELLLMQGDEAGVEASLQKAVEVARRQQAKSWELRATVSLCRLWQEQGRMDEAHQMLAEIYGWFTEGFDTPDLQEAKALLEELSRN